MYKGSGLKAPFFEIGPKQYLFGDDVLTLAYAADRAAKKYDVDIIFTTPFCDIRRVAEATERILVFAPHMDPIRPGRGTADILPESIKAAGAVGVMINHCEKPVSLGDMEAIIRRADELDLLSCAIADSIAQARAIANLHPNIIVAEPTELIGTGKISDMSYVQASIEAIKSVDPDIFVLQAAGIKSGEDVYRNIYAGAEATGTSSGCAAADDPCAVADEMIRAVREAYDARTRL